MSAPTILPAAFPATDHQMAHSIAYAAVQHIEDPEERERAYLLARGQASAGMSLRDHFAGLAMQGMVAGHFSHYGHENFWKREDIAAEAYAMADAMLKARSA